MIFPILEIVAARQFLKLLHLQTKYGKENFRAQQYHRKSMMSIISNISGVAGLHLLCKPTLQPWLQLGPKFLKTQVGVEIVEAQVGVEILGSSILGWSIARRATGWKTKVCTETGGAPEGQPYGKPNSVQKGGAPPKDSRMGNQSLY
jgi:hypothetical protein